MARAAEDLSISQPAISKAMADLEISLGVSLLHRSSRGVSITDCGRVLVRRSRAVFDEIRQGLVEIEHLSDPTRGEVRIGTGEAMTAFVSTIVDRASRQYPRMSYHVSVHDVTTLLRGLRDRDLDLVIARWTPSNSERDLVAEILFRDRLHVMAGIDHALAKRRTQLTLAELANERWALPGFLPRENGRAGFPRRGPRSPSSDTDKHFRTNAAEFIGERSLSDHSSQLATPAFGQSRQVQSAAGRASRCGRPDCLHQIA